MSNVKHSQVSLGFFIWSTTGSIKMAHMRAQANVLGYMAMGSPNTMGMVLEPIFGHQKGLTYMDRHQALRLLADQNLFVDHHFYAAVRRPPGPEEGQAQQLPWAVGPWCRGERHGLQVQE